MIEKVTENVFNEVQQPDVCSWKFISLSRSEQLEKIYKFKEYLLEQEIFFCMNTCGKTFKEALEDAEIKEEQKDVAQAKINWFKSIGETNKNYIANLRTKNYILTKPDDETVQTKWKIRMYVETMPLVAFAKKEDLSIAR